MTDFSARADDLTRRLQAASAARLRSRTVSDPKGLVTFEMDERNELSRVKVTPNWQRLSSDQFSEACVGAYQALGDAILRDWAETLTADEDDLPPVAPAPPVKDRGPTTAASLPPDDVLMSLMERTAGHFAELEKLRAAPDTDTSAASTEVVGRSECRKVSATFTADGILTAVDIDPAWTSGSPVRLGEAIAEAIRDAVAQGERLEAEKARNPYADLSNRFAQTQVETHATLRRSGLI